MTGQTPGHTMREHEDEHGPHGPGSEKIVGDQARSFLPSLSGVVQAGAFGAALGGVTTGVQDMARVKQGEITTDEAIDNVVKSSAQGAMTMAVASVAAQVVRSHPVFGFIALAAAGIGAFSLLSGKSKKEKDEPAVEASDLPDKPVSHSSKAAPRRPSTSKTS